VVKMIVAASLCIGALRVSAPVAAAKHHHRSDNNRHHKWNKNYVAIWRGGIITMRVSAPGTIAAGRLAALAERKGAAPI